MKELARLKSIVDRLRSPGGCPWDLEQTPESLKTFLLEEAHEVAEAIDSGRPGPLREELGDLLLNVFLQARIAEERDQFSLDDVAAEISEKLIRRHPHVFGDDEARDPAAVRRRWEEIKSEEKARAGTGGGTKSALRRLPASLPALVQAERVGAMAAEVGFDWSDYRGAFAKIEEEIEELREALESDARDRMEAEVGDLLLAVTSLCRHLSLDSERALKRALERFRRRFAEVEKGIAARDGITLEEMETLWQEAKRGEARSPRQGG
jgi:MazG family protein